jgi:hypothetical protein
LAPEEGVAVERSEETRSGDSNRSNLSLLRRREATLWISSPPNLPLVTDLIDYFDIKFFEGQAAE